MNKRLNDKSNFYLAKGKSNIPRFPGIGRYLLVFGLGIMLGFPFLTLYQSKDRDVTNNLLAAAHVQDIVKHKGTSTNQFSEISNSFFRSLPTGRGLYNSLDSLLRMSADELSRLDLARMNLLCGEI
jgi:hypothetical protein